MSGLYTWIQRVAGFLILSAFLRELLPGQRFEPFLRHILGVLLILIVLQPVLAAGGLDSWLETRISRWEETWESLEDVSLAGEDWEELQWEFWKGEAVSQAEQEIRDIVEEHDLEMLDCDMKVEGEESSVQVRVRDTAHREEEAVSEAAGTAEEEIRAALSLDQVTVEVDE
ncbi:MAG: stage III sporulation protein AF [Lachnospiraceae bacterium]|nr:stage III sporulation protein AF [Lachnospiraceae bacterium]